MNPNRVDLLPPATGDYSLVPARRSSPVGEPVIELEPGSVDRHNIFQAFYTGYNNQASQALRLAWFRERDAWLRANRKGRPNSPATRRAYEYATNAFADFTGLDWWLVTADHVRAWQDHMRAAGLSEATINQRLSAVSSFYSYVIREQKLGADGVERGLFFDAHGRTRQNPFRSNNVERIAVSRKGKSRPISQSTIANLIHDINTNHVEGARDAALLLTFLLTGWRNDEVITMTWGQIRPNDDRPGEYIFAWHGKGSKAQDDPLPARAYHAILHYLKLAGRWLPGHVDHVQDNDYIWQPLRDHGIANFPNVTAAGSPGDATYRRRHISPTQANNILRKHLRRALRKSGLTAAEAEQRAAAYHIHSLRHTFAHSMRKAKFDVLTISRRMHHSGIAVTQTYLDSLEPPQDDYSQALQLAMGI